MSKKKNDTPQEDVNKQQDEVFEQELDLIPEPTTTDEEPTQENDVEKPELPFVPVNGDEIILHRLHKQGVEVVTRKELMSMGFNAGVLGVLRDDGCEFPTYKLVTTGKKDQFTIHLV
jgi:hypothetical protein